MPVLYARTDFTTIGPFLVKKITDMLISRGCFATIHVFEEKSAGGMAASMATETVSIAMLA